MKTEIKKIKSFVTLHSKNMYNCSFNRLPMNKTLLFRLLFTGLTCIILSSDVMAQDPQFSQFYANPLYLNPAFAGTARCPRVVMNYRNQWPGIPGNFVTYSASYDQHVDDMNGGLGVLVMNDRAGAGARRRRLPPDREPEPGDRQHLGEEARGDRGAGLQLRGVRTEDL